MENLILVIEDEPISQKIAIESLKKIGDVKVTATLSEARKFLNTNSPDLVILDFFLPDGNGMKFFEEMQTSLGKSQTPVFFVSGNDEIGTKIAAFSSGACDYLVKPYSPLELRARAERILKDKRSEQIYRDESISLALDLNSYKGYQTFGNDNIDLSLTPHEFKILFLFLRNMQKVYSRQQILDQAWGKDVFISARTVDAHISSLRKKLANVKIKISSIRGEGYCAEYQTLKDVA